MVRELSLGERMKMELIASLLHQAAKFCFSTSRPSAWMLFRKKPSANFLREHNAKRKTTILLTSHYMADIQELCQRVIIIDHGSIFFDGKLKEVIDRFADFKLITIQCEPGAATDRAILEECGEVVEQTAARSNSKSSATA